MLRSAARFQCGIDADGLALYQASVRELAQDPGEDGLMRLEIDQAPRTRQRRMIRWALLQLESEKAPNAQRVRGTPRDGALRVQALEVSEPQQAKIATWLQAWTTHLVRIKLLAQTFDIRIEFHIVENLIQSAVEGVRRTARQVSWRHPHRRGSMGGGLSRSRR
jgi:hypothetical protein